MAVSMASAGSTLTLRLTRRGMPLIPLLAWSMGFGAIFLLLIALALSAAFEGWLPSWVSAAGMALCLGALWAATRTAAVVTQG